ncbi:MAG: chemotaxis protein CheA [Sulfuriflexus sp.]|nr:chemotaxis protein CheA [Sulfuriflexus sp.]
MSIDMEQFHQTFFEESFEGLDIMENELLNLDVGNADNESINTIFRSAHSIKGGSGTFGFTAIAEFTHVAETLLDEMRDGTRQVTQEAVDILLKSVDVMRDMLGVYKDGGDMDEENNNAVQKELEDLLGVEGASASDEGSNDSANETTAGGWQISFRPHIEMLRTGNDPVRMMHALGELGKIEVVVNISELPSFADLNPEDSFLSWEITLTGDISKDDIVEVFDWVEDECDLDIQPIVNESENVAEAPQAAASDTLATEKAEKDPAAKKATAKKGGSETASIRVGIDKVDEIINLVGELVITQAMLGQVGGEISEDEKHDESRMEKLLEGLAQLERNTREIQESVMRIRMLPISFVFSRVPRLVHDLSSKLNKKVNLVTLGEGTELDKTVMEKIGDPMVHLVRNALDHGIETPEQRLEAGKDETGTLTLNAYHKGGNIVIELSDDGAGINKERVLNKARSNGLVGENEELSDDAINDLIFHPGLSTAEALSDVSGRGVGMDVVRKNIKSLGGSVRVDSTEGKGAVFTIQLPLTLAILDGQLVKVGNETFVVPLVSIIESIQVKSDNLNGIAGKADLYKLRDEYIPIIRADHIFNMHGGDSTLDNRLMVVVEGDGHKAGIIVDDLLAQQQVVIKSLETNYQRVDGISGATILGDGTVALILDISGMIDMYKEKGTPEPTTPVTPPQGNDSDIADEAA